MGAAFIAAVKPIVGLISGVATAATAVKTFTEKAPEVPAVTPAPVPTITEEKKPITEAPEVATQIAKEEEKKRRSVENQLLKLMDFTPIGIIVYDVQGELKYANNTAREI